MTFEQKLFNAIRPQRSPIRKRRKQSRSGREINRAYVTWMHLHGCLVAGRRSDSPCWGVRTVHHVRHITHPDGTIERTGRRDRRTLTLCEGHHLPGHTHSIHTLTGNNGGEWERFFSVDVEREIRRYNHDFEGRTDCECRFTGDHADASECPLHGVSRPPAVRLVMDQGGDSCPF